MCVCVSNGLVCWLALLLFLYSFFNTYTLTRPIFSLISKRSSVILIHTHFISLLASLQIFQLCRFYGGYKDCVCIFLLHLLLPSCDCLYLCVFVHCVYSISIVSTYSRRKKLKKNNLF